MPFGKPPSAFNYDNAANGFGMFDYLIDIQPFIPGQVSDAFDRKTDTVSCATPVGFGIVLCAAKKPSYDKYPERTSLAFKAELPSPDNKNFMGVAQHEHLDPIVGGVNHAPPQMPGTTLITTPYQIQFPPKWPIPLLKQGRIAAICDEDLMTVNYGDPVFVRLVAEGTNVVGQVRANATAGQAESWSKAYFTGRIMPKKLAEIAILMP